MKCGGVDGGWLLGCVVIIVIIVITLPVISGPGLASASPARHTGGFISAD